jgi:hypothetical protein
MNTRLDKAINGLKKIAERYNRHDIFEFDETHIKIKPKTDKTLWIWLYIIFLIVTPFSILVYLLTQGESGSLTFILVFCLGTYFGITLYSLLRGQQTLTVELSSKQFVLENIHKTFTRMKEPTLISFSEVHTITLKQKALRYNNRWRRISFCDSKGSILAYIDLGNEFPDSIIAEKVKSFLDVVLWTFKEKQLD